MASIDADATAAPAQSQVSEAPLSVKVCLGFGVGTVGVSVVLNTVAVYFPALMSTVLGVSPAIAGAMLMGSKLYDAFADIFIGGLSDRTKTRWGRRRPFLLAGALTSAASLLMIFVAPQLQGPALLIYMGVALVLYSTGYSFFNVPYLAMPAEMTDGYNERLRLISYRTGFVAIGQIFSMSVTAYLIQLGGSGAAGFRLMGMVMAGIALATMLACFFGTADARFAERVSGHKLSWADVRSLVSNRPLVMLMGAKLTQYTAFGIMGPANLLFLLNVARTGYAGMIHYSLVQNIFVFGSMPLWVWLGKRIGKRNAYMLGIITMAASSLSWLTVSAGVPMWEIWLRAATFGLGSGGSLLMSTSMLPDAMEYDRLRTGHRREGVFSSLYAINEKLGFALGALVLGAALSAGGYIATTGGKIIDQGPEAISALYMVKALVPSGALLFGLIMVWFYDLDQKKLRETAEAAGERR